VALAQLGFGLPGGVVPISGSSWRPSSCSSVSCSVDAVMGLTSTLANRAWRAARRMLSSS
jgi:hypothetical protein